MRFTLKLAAWALSVLLVESATASNFRNDVVQPAGKQRRNDGSLEQRLLRKAMPVQEYEKLRGVSLSNQLPHDNHRFSNSCESNEHWKRKH